MNKEGLIEAVMGKIGGTKSGAEDAINAVFDAITSAMGKGDDVAISGFGTFKVTKRAARQGVNPRTGAKISIPAMNVPKFKAGKGLKEAVK
ncbi:MAG: HU family DNA-binding protein [Parcubacteria group bacterium]|nr:HU family DNA-binding protein [Parcubacteria group bacterium]